MWGSGGNAESGQSKHYRVYKPHLIGSIPATIPTVITTAVTAFFTGSIQKKQRGQDKKEGGSVLLRGVEPGQPGECARALLPHPGKHAREQEQNTEGRWRGEAEEEI